MSQHNLKTSRIARVRETVMRKENFSLSWYGMLTVENIEQVADLVRQLLVGRTYTFVAANEYRDYKPQVRTNQHMTRSNAGDPVNVYYDESAEKRFAGFSVCDTYGIWGVSTNLKDDLYDPDFKNPFVNFENDKVTITHRAASGNKIYWVIALERP